MRRQQLAPIDARLDGAQAAEDAHLFDVANDWNYVESFELRVNCVEAADEMLEEDLEGLGQAEQEFALVRLGPLLASALQVLHHGRIWGRHEGGDAVAAVVDHAALVGGQVVERGRRIVGARGRRLARLLLLVGGAAWLVVLVLLLLGCHCGGCGGGGGSLLKGIVLLLLLEVLLELVRVLQ